MAEKTLAQLTERKLAWLLLRQLCQMYSAGGISGGRSFRSTMLDCWILEERTPDIQNIDAWHWPELLEEARARFLKPHMQISLSVEPFPISSDKLSRRQLGYCLLRASQDWYRQYGMEWQHEVEILDAAVRLLYGKSYADAPLNPFDPEYLRLHANDRFRVKVKRETRIKRTQLI